MANHLVLVSIKRQIPLTQALNDAKSEADSVGTAPMKTEVLGKFYYFFDNANGEVSNTELKKIIWLLLANPSAELYNKQTKLKVYANFIDEHTVNLLVDYYDYQIAFPKLALPSASDLATILEPDQKPMELAQPFKWDLNLLRAAFKRHLFTGPTYLQAEYFDRPLAHDEQLFPPLAQLQYYDEINTELHAKFQTLKSNTQTALDLLKTAKSLKTCHFEDAMRIEQNITQLQTDCRAEEKAQQQQQESLKEIAKSISDNYAIVLTNTTLQKIRQHLVRCLQLTALHFYVQEFSGKATDGVMQSKIQKFNEKFENIAAVQLKEQTPLLAFNKNLLTETFKSLQTLVNDLLKAFYVHSGSIPYVTWGKSKEKNGLAAFFQADPVLSAYATLSKEQNTFAWHWKQLHTLNLEISANLTTDVDKSRRTLAQTTKKLDQLIMDADAISAKIQQLQLRASNDANKLKKDQHYLETAAANAEQQAKRLKADYLALPQQMVDLQKLLAELAQSAATMQMPFAAIAMATNRAEELFENILQQHVTHHNVGLDVTACAVNKVHEFETELNTTVTEFNKNVEPISRLLRDAESIKLQLADNLERISAQDNVIIAVRKLVSLLDNKEFFSQQVRWWGGTMLKANGRQWTVPLSYWKMLEVKATTLQEPLDYRRAKSFLDIAKKIVEQAEDRQGFVYSLFRLRSKPMRALHSLIKELNIDSPTFTSDIDDKLKSINPAWRFDIAQQAHAMSSAETPFEPAVPVSVKVQQAKPPRRAVKATTLRSPSLTSASLESRHLATHRDALNISASASVNRTRAPESSATVAPATSAVFAPTPSSSASSSSRATNLSMASFSPLAPSRSRLASLRQNPGEVKIRGNSGEKALLSKVESEDKNAHDEKSMAGALFQTLPLPTQPTMSLSAIGSTPTSSSSSSASLWSSSSAYLSHSLDNS